MLRLYSSSGNQNAAAAVTILGVTSATTIKPSVYTIICGSAATPADQAVNLKASRFTAAGTATAFTPLPLDPNTPAALAAAGYNHTVEPTYTAGGDLISASFNQQNTFKWETLPEYGLVCPGTAANGVGIQFAVSTGTALFEATCFHQE